MFTYLTQVSVCTAAFFALYRLVFCRLSFYRFNRFYLLLTFLFSFLIPLVSVQIERERPIEEREIATPAHTGAIELHENFTEKEGEPATNWEEVALTVYAGVSLCMFILFLYNLSAMLILCRKKGIPYNGVTLIERDHGHVNFSFFRYIFIGKSSIAQHELELFIAHEKFHARQYHSIDRLLLSLGKSVLWFNPFAYLYNREIALQHEYEADAYVSARFGKKAYAHVLLNAASRQPGFYGLCNAFAKKPVKSRIHQIFKPNTSNMKKSLYVMALPLLALLGWNYSVEKVYPSASPAGKFTVVLDAGHGGTDNGAEANGLYEKDLALALTKSLSTQLKNNNIDVVMTRENDESVLLADRAASKGDFLLSLHVNTISGRKSTEDNGVIMLLPVWKSEEKPDDRRLKSLFMSQTIFESLRAGQKLNVNAGATHNQRVKVLEESLSPALLIELGYMTNPGDLKYITSTRGREEIASALTRAIIKYRDAEANSVPEPPKN